MHKPLRPIPSVCIVCSSLYVSIEAILCVINLKGRVKYKVNNRNNRFRMLQPFAISLMVQLYLKEKLLKRNWDISIQYSDERCVRKMSRYTQKSMSGPSMNYSLAHATITVIPANHSTRHRNLNKFDCIEQCSQQHAYCKVPSFMAPQYF